MDYILLRAAFVNLLACAGGGTGLFIPRGSHQPRPPEEVVVLTPGRIPTTDLYLRGRLEGRNGDPVRYVDTLKTAPHEIALGANTRIVIVRHAPMRWLRWLDKNHERLSGVVFFMDDDIPAAAAASELPLRYAMKTAWRHARTRRLLGRICSEVWVSTPELARRYAEASPRLVEPEYVADNPAEAEPVVYFYHGSWAHRREMEWLVPVVRRVQEAVSGAWFEIMGTDRVRRLFRGIPRVRVIHPMDWKDYLAYAATVRYQVGLAPCLDSDFNRARSHSKMFDITRLGAAGIYSNGIAYAGKVIHEQTGILCENKTDAWVSAIVRLLTEGRVRDLIYRQALTWCENGRS
jgi:hypothetical protein